MSSVLRQVTLIVIIAVVSGCKNLSPDADVAAVIKEPTDASRLELQTTVSEVFGTEVMLAPDALTGSSVLFIEPRMMSSMDGSPLQGRILERPVELRLVTNGADCVLIDTRDMSRHVLADTTCTAE